MNNSFNDKPKATAKASNAAFLSYIVLAFVSVLDTSVLAGDWESLPDAQGRWTIEQANAWYDKLPFLAGADFIPSTAGNQLEMWMAETFDEATIDRELGYAKALGFNSMRVFLHDLLWIHDRDGFLKRIERYLEIADRHGIRTLFVFFDSCWDPYPRWGKQPDPRARTHNSLWVQSPGMEVLLDSTRQMHLKAYVQGVLRHFASDPRILAWDLWNEPDNFDGGVRSTPAEPRDKPQLVLPLLKATFDWAREVSPTQPLTSAVWRKPWQIETLDETKQVQLSQSDVISFHCYGKPRIFQETIQALRNLKRPMLCTEYMDRQSKSTFDPLLGLMKQEKIAGYCWGFVNGRSQTIYPTSSWRRDFTSEPETWTNEILYPDGTPYRKSETDYIRQQMNPSF